jgi:hypothetical protein
VHQLAERKVYEEHRDQEDVPVKEPMDIRRHRIETEQSHAQFFDNHDVGLDEVPQDDAGGSDSQEQEQGEIVTEQGYVAHLRAQYPSKEQIGQSGQQHEAARVRDRHTYLEKTIQILEQNGERGYRFRKESHVPQKDNEKGVVEGESTDPQPFVGPVNSPALLDLRPRIPEKGTKEKHLECHPADDTQGVPRVVEAARFDPGKRLFLSTGGGYPERNRRFSPIHHAVNHAAEKNDDGGVWHNHPEEELKAQDLDSQGGRQKKRNNGYE